ncbi:MAG: hypothetical protein JY451_03270 [Erythrobacter sp.]|nr:MAG: hypothetical protein JY451_03270 [Erythrobacter sp.]
MNRIILSSFVSAAALSVAACESEEEEPVPVEDVDTMGTTEPMMEDGYPVAGDLSAEQQAAYDAMDRQATSDEYDANREAMMAESGNSAGTDTGTSSGSTGNGGNDNMASSGNSSTSGIPPRSQMDFAWLDRNSDGQLSVAEYAIWAIPTDPTQPEPNDETRPYLTQDEINTAGQTFFYFDDDGDTYLSQAEFTQARNSSRTPG